ncbi:hypothetical protein H6F88_17495 [Oculatella sp. FACHB-28]|uniref:hypothetical protein n=1 Tax=Oculatella sp. FACHB-28 TaxID=2692845 RepID=UPI0016858576|nr:hypothetical protein [Oculatella sp. FACHB-28]MBD2057792.1 hypothetical protein [Oculatella sp. FACHB-28]
MPANDDSARFAQMLLGLSEVITKRNCKTKYLYDELKPKLNKCHDRAQIIRKLDRFAREHKVFEIGTDEGLWIAYPIGKQGTRYYHWNLIFRPLVHAT